MIDRKFIFEDDRMVVVASQDATPILDANKAMQNDGDGFSKSREMKRIGSIPFVVAEKWLTEEGINVFDPNHAEAVRRKLNSNEYLYLRTSGGRF